MILQADFIFEGLRRLGYSGTVDDMAAVVLDKATHTNISRMWNKAIKDLKRLGGDVTVYWIIKNAEEIYKETPDLLEQTMQWISSNF